MRFAPLILFFLIPQSAAAQLVTCAGPDCNFCTATQMVDGLIGWLIGILVLVAVLLLCVAGFKLVTSAGNSSAVGEAKQMLVNVIVGFVIILAAWTIVDTLIKTLAGGDLGVWNPVACGEMFEPIRGDSYEGGNVSVTTPNTSTSDAGELGDISGCSGGSCVRLSTPCKNSSSCSVAPGLVNAINSMHTQAAVSGARVTEAMPPTRTHRSSCHSNGTCVDYSKAGGMSAAEVLRVINAARANGLRPVYEVATQSEKNSLVSQGVNGSDIIVLGSHISAAHFSIYAN